MNSKFRDKFNDDIECLFMDYMYYKDPWLLDAIEGISEFGIEFLLLAQRCDYLNDDRYDKFFKMEDTLADCTKLISDEFRPVFDEFMKLVETRLKDSYWFLLVDNFRLCSVVNNNCYREIREEIVNGRHYFEKTGLLPDGEYFLQHMFRDMNNKHWLPYSADAKMRVDNGRYVVLAGSECNIAGRWNRPLPKLLKQKLADNCFDGRVLLEDVECSSLHEATSFVLGASYNGWREWKDIYHHHIQVYRDRYYSKF